MTVLKTHVKHSAWTNHCVLRCTFIYGFFMPNFQASHCLSLTLPYLGKEHACKFLAPSSLQGQSGRGCVVSIRLRAFGC